MNQACHYTKVWRLVFFFSCLYIICECRKCTHSSTIIRKAPASWVDIQRSKAFQITHSVSAALLYVSQQEKFCFSRLPTRCINPGLDLLHISSALVCEHNNERSPATEHCCLDEHTYKYYRKHVLKIQSSRQLIDIQILKLFTSIFWRKATQQETVAVRSKYLKENSGVSGIF